MHSLFTGKAYSLVPSGKKLDIMKIFAISPNGVNIAHIFFLLPSMKRQM